MSYKSSITEQIPKYWKVTTNEKEGCYVKTKFVGVVALDVLSAVNAVLSKYPGATVVSINHEGPVNVIADLTTCN